MRVLDDVWRRLGGDPAQPDRLTVTGPRRTLRSALPVTEAGTAAVGASLLAATPPTAQVSVDTRGLAVALRSERHTRREGHLAGPPFDPLSAFHRAADGWIRLHANYSWHRAAALRVLSCADDIDAVRAAARRWPAEDLETAIHEAGGVAAAVRAPDQWHAPDLPLVQRHDLGHADPRPARRLRVLDLTRVIAGPVATRTLAVHGADVLRLDPPDRPEIALQWWDMLPGKRSALLDLADRDTREELLGGADVVVTGYRPGALDRFGFAPQALADRHPGLTVVTLSAWGHLGAWAPRRGFDSLVQAACGIAVLEGGPDAPGALPAQLLDHATGYLAAAGALLAVADQRARGGTPHVRFSLLGTAQWLLALPRGSATDFDEVEQDQAIDPTPYLRQVDDFTLAAPPGAVDGRPLDWPPPAPSFGSATPRWLAR